MAILVQPAVLTNAAENGLHPHPLTRTPETAWKEAIKDMGDSRFMMHTGMLRFSTNLPRDGRTISAYEMYPCDGVIGCSDADNGEALMTCTGKCRLRVRGGGGRSRVGEVLRDMALKQMFPRLPMLNWADFSSFDEGSGSPLPGLVSIWFKDLRGTLRDGFMEGYGAEYSSFDLAFTVYPDTHTADGFAGLDAWARALLDDEYERRKSTIARLESELLGPRRQG